MSFVITSMILFEPYLKKILFVGSMLWSYDKGYTNQFAALDASYMLSSNTRDSSFVGYLNQDGYCCPVSMDPQQLNTEASFERRLSRHHLDPGTDRVDP